MLNPVHLRTFIVVLETGSFATAARQLGYTGSAVSQQMASLEKSSGMLLFERSAHGVRATPAAEFLSARARELLAAMGAFEDEVGAMSSGSVGRVRLGSFPTASQQLLPLGLADLGRNHAGVRVHLDEGEPEHLVPRLVDRDLDLALVYQYDLVPSSWPRSLLTTRLLDEELILLLPSGHHFSSSSGISLSDLRDETWISTGEHTSGGISLRRACAVAGFAPNIAYRSNDYSVVRGFVRSGLGVALVPALSRVPTEGVVERTLTEFSVQRHVMAIHPPTTLNAAVRGAVASLLVSARDAAVRIPGVDCAVTADSAPRQAPAGQF